MALELRKLGRTGLKVPSLCLGVNAFEDQVDDEATAREIVEVALESGINFFDTSPIQPLSEGYRRIGETEKLLGSWLETRRNEVILATKCTWRTGDHPWQAGSSRKAILLSLEQSLKRLRTDYVDVLYLGHPDPETPIEETVRVLHEVIQSGKARYVGVSNFLAYQVARVIGKAEAHDLIRIECVQPRYNLLFREIERELLPLCRDEALGVIAFNPLAGGMLTGKYASGIPRGSRFDGTNAAGALYQERYGSEGKRKSVQVLDSIARQASLSLPNLAVSWVLSNDAITSALVGASKVSHVAAMVKASTIKLPVTILKECDEVTRDYRYGDAVR